MSPMHDEAKESESKKSDCLHAAVVNTIKRIENNPHALGVLFFRKGFVETCTVPLHLVQPLTTGLPPLTERTQRAIGEIKYIMKIISNLLKDSKDEWLVQTTASINEVNPIVDRIMEDESVEGVIMTNKEGSPILTNINLTAATNYGIALRRLGFLTQICVTEIDPVDEVLILRVKTKKIEMMVAPHRDYHVIVVQHSRHKLKQKKG